MYLQKCTHFIDSRSLVCIGLDLHVLIDFTRRFPLDTLCLVCWWLLLVWIGFVDLFNYLMYHQFPWQVDVKLASTKWLTATSWNVTSQWILKTSNRWANQTIVMDQSHPQLQPIRWWWILRLIHKLPEFDAPRGGFGRHIARLRTQVLRICFVIFT